MGAAPGPAAAPPRLSQPKLHPGEGGRRAGPHPPLNTSTCSAVCPLPSRCVLPPPPDSCFLGLTSGLPVLASSLRGPSSCLAGQRASCLPFPRSLWDSVSETGAIRVGELPSWTLSLVPPAGWEPRASQAGPSQSAWAPRHPRTAALVSLAPQVPLLLPAMGGHLLHRGKGRKEDFSPGLWTLYVMAKIRNISPT